MPALDNLTYHDYLDPGMAHLHNFLEDLYDVFVVGLEFKEWTGRYIRLEYTPSTPDAHYLIFQRFCDRYNFVCSFHPDRGLTAIEIPVWVIEGGAPFMWDMVKYTCATSIRTSADIILIGIKQAAIEMRKKAAWTASQAAWYAHEGALRENRKVVADFATYPLFEYSAGPQPEVLKRVRLKTLMERSR